MENEILLKIICHGALLPADTESGVHTLWRNQKGERARASPRRQGGLPAPKWPGEVHAFV